MSDEKPEIYDVEVAAAKRLRATMRTVVIGLVVAYDDLTQQAVVQPVRRGADLSGRPYDLPQIQGVPVLWPSWGGGLRVQGQLLPGDEVVMLISDRSIEQFLMAGTIVDSRDGRTHNISDALALPVSISKLKTLPPSLGSMHVGHAAPGVPRAEVTISPPTAPSAVEVEALQIKLGELATVGAARVGDTVGAGTSMATWITAVSTATGATPPLDFGSITSGSTKTQIE